MFWAFKIKIEAILLSDHRARAKNAVIATLHLSDRGAVRRELNSRSKRAETFCDYQQSFARELREAPRSWDISGSFRAHVRVHIRSLRFFLLLSSFGGRWFSVDSSPLSFPQMLTRSNSSFVTLTFHQLLICRFLFQHLCFRCLWFGFERFGRL